MRPLQGNSQWGLPRHSRGQCWNWASYKPGAQGIPEQSHLPSWRQKLFYTRQLPAILISK